MGIDKLGGYKTINVGRAITSRGWDYRLLIFEDFPEHVYAQCTGKIDDNGTWTGFPLGGNVPMHMQAHAQPMHDLKEIIADVRNIVFTKDYEVLPELRERIKGIRRL